MAIKRGGQSHLRNRVINVGSNTATVMGSYHPAGTKDTPMVMPVAQVTMTAADAHGYSTVMYEDLTPIWATDGAAVPATTPGSWGQLRAAGRP